MLIWLCFAIHTAFVVWVMFYGGAERLEGSILAALALGRLAPFLSARLLSAYALFSWIANGAVLLLNSSA